MKALADTRLVGGGVPVAFAAGDAPLVRPEPGLAYLPSGLTRDFRYTVRSYAPQPTSGGLGLSKPTYPHVLVAPGGFLDVWPGATAPPFGSASRRAQVNALVDANPDVQRYTRLEQIAFAVAGRARTPYAATVDLESWFRKRGGFSYTDHPAVFSAAPLVGFVAETRAGYCQYFAGAMALMLRYLGVPARVAVGFSSGTYDARSGVWTVTDHDAHAWVEVWFRGYGWLPFDPTPSAGRPERGQLTAAYSSASRGFDLRRAGVTPAGAGANVVAQSAHRHGETGPAIDGDRWRERRRRRRVAEHEHRDAFPRRARRGARRDRRDEARRCVGCATSRATRAASPPRAAASSRTISSTSGSKPRAARRCTSSAVSSDASSPSIRIRSSPPQPPHASAARMAPAAPRAPRAASCGRSSAASVGGSPHAERVRGLLSLRSLG